MALSGTTVVGVGLVSDALFLHWLQSLFLSSWGDAFKEQENFPGSWVRFSWQCFWELGRTSTSCGWLWNCWGEPECLELNGQNRKQSLDALNKHNPWGRRRKELNMKRCNCNCAPEARAVWPSPIPWLLCPPQPSCPGSVRTGCVSHLQLHWLILYFLLYCDCLKVLKAIPQFLLAATWNYCRM